jgi:hypothetical protein
MNLRGIVEVTDPRQAWDVPCGANGLPAREVLETTHLLIFHSGQRWIGGGSLQAVMVGEACARLA